MSGRSWIVHLSLRSSKSHSVGSACSDGVAREDVNDQGDRCAYSIHLRRDVRFAHLLDCGEEVVDAGHSLEDKSSEEFVTGVGRARQFDAGYQA